MTPALARRMLVLALALGILADALLNVNSWRAGFVLWLLLVLGVALYVFERSTDAEPLARRERRILYGSAGLIAMLLVLRDAPSLYAVDFFAFLVMLFLVAWRAGGRRLTQLEPRDALIGVASSFTAFVAGAPMLALRDADVAAIGDVQRRSFKGFGLGALLAAPVLLVVTGLLASADPVFAGFLERAGSFLNGRVVAHVLFAAIATWVTAGALRGSIGRVGIPEGMFRGQLRLAFPIVAPLLGGLALLLSAWIGLQVRTLFGGSEYVSATAGVTVAQYARRGFFELINIAGIVLAALLVVDDVLEREEGSARATFRTMGQVLIGLVGAVLVSAVLRLGLYLRYFGLTDDRVLALGVLVWVAVVLLWFGLTVLRDQRARFAPGVLVLSALWIVALNAANPERIVVRTNLARAEQGAPFDVAYHARLSGDALPALLAGADRLGPPRATELRTALRAEWTRRASERTDWREWSVPFALGARRNELTRP